MGYLENFISIFLHAMSSFPATVFAMVLNGAEREVREQKDLTCLDLALIVSGTGVHLFISHCDCIIITPLMFLHRLLRTISLKS